MGVPGTGAGSGMARDEILVVVAVDHGPASLAAFHRAVRVFRRHPGAAFHLVHVRPDHHSDHHDLHRAQGQTSDKTSLYAFSDLWARVRPDHVDLHKAHGQATDKLSFSDLWARVEREHDGGCAEVLSEYRLRALDEGVRFTAVELVGGSTTQALREYCARVEADLLVVGTLKRFLLPTVHRPVFLWCHGKKSTLRQMRVTG